MCRGQRSSPESKGAANDPTTLRGALAKFCSSDALPDARVIAGVPASEWDKSVGDAVVLVSPRDGDTPA
eukprot:10556136-Alexandrium_andersonii.AAC.1